MGRVPRLLRLSHVSAMVQAMSALLLPHVGPECQCVPGATAHGNQMMGQMGYLVSIACAPLAPSCRPLRCSKSARAPQMIKTCCLDAKEILDFIIQYSANPNIFFCSSVGQSERLLTVRSQVRALPGERHFLTSYHFFFTRSLNLHFSSALVFVHCFSTMIKPNYFF
jgi:hypothetical protein